jgi:hypothetical protein
MQRILLTNEVTERKLPMDEQTVNQIESRPSNTGELDFRWSSECDKLFGALAKAQANFTAVAKNRTAGKGGASSFSYRYADYADVLEMALPCLAKEGIAFMQPIHGDKMSCFLVHSSGQWIKASANCPVAQKIQDQGAVFTYMKRYTMSALLGVSAQEDTDAQGVDTTSKSTGKSNQSNGKSGNQKTSQETTLLEGNTPVDLMEAIAKCDWAKPHMKNHFSKHWNEYMARFDNKGRVKFATDYGVLMDAKKTETA